MNSNAILKSDVLDIIFENRNKNYGAYAIRSSYNDSIIKSLLCISSFVLLLFFSVFVYNKYNTLPGEEKKLFADDLKIEDLIYQVNIEPLKAPDELPQPQEAAVVAAVLRVVEPHLRRRRAPRRARHCAGARRAGQP